MLRLRSFESPLVKSVGSFASSSAKNAVMFCLRVCIGKKVFRLESYLLVCQLIGNFMLLHQVGRLNCSRVMVH